MGTGSAGLGEHTPSQAFNFPKLHKPASLLLRATHVIGIGCLQRDAEGADIVLPMGIVIDCQVQATGGQSAAGEIRTNENHRAGGVTRPTMAPNGNPSTRLVL